MTWMEMKSDMESVKRAIENELKKMYLSSAVDGNTVFHSEKAGDFRIYAMGKTAPWNFFVIEYNDEEDGDGFYPDDYDSLSSMVSDVVSEIEY